MENRFSERFAMEAKVQHAMGQLMSRAAVLVKVGMVDIVSTFLYGASLRFEIRIKGEDSEWELDFGYNEIPYDENAVNATLKHMDEVIAEARGKAEYALKVFNNWEA